MALSAIHIHTPVAGEMIVPIWDAMTPHGATEMIRDL